MKFLFNVGGYTQLVKTLEDRGHQVVKHNCQFRKYVNKDQRWQEYNQKILPQLIQEHKPDVYICSKGFAKNKHIWPETNLKIKKMVGLMVYWSQDDPFFIPTFRNLQMHRGYDVALTCSNVHKPYREVGIEPHTFYPAWDSIERSVTPRASKTDVIFVGSPYKTTNIPRAKIMRWIAEQGHSLKIFGAAAWTKKGSSSLFQGDPFLRPYYKGVFKNWRDLHNLFASSRINISNHVRQAPGYLNDRVFLVMGAGGFLLMDNNPGIEKLFKHNRHVCYYRDWGTFKHRFTYYLAHDDARKAIAKAGQKLILAEHTYANRADQLLDIVKGKV